MDTIIQDVLSRAMEWERRSDVHLRWVAEAEARGEREIAREHFIDAEAHDVQARVDMGLPC